MNRGDPASSDALVPVPLRTPASPASSLLSDDTRSRILAVATTAFAERGIENVTLRELTALAGANVAAINYHFGSKEGLTEAIFEELAPRLNAVRMRELAQILDTAARAGARPAVADIVASFARPYFAPEHAQDGGLLAQLVLKHRLAPSAMTQRVIARHFDPMAQQYIRAFAMACPDVAPVEFAWRYMFMAGAVVLAATDRRQSNRITTLSEGRLHPADGDALLAALTRFVEGGLRHPEPAASAGPAP